jgi:integrase
MILNKKNIAQIEPPEKNYFLVWDDKLKGFGVRVTANGVKSFIVQTRIRSREHRKTLGRVGVLGVEEARKLAMTFLAEVASGGDPISRATEEKVIKVSLQEVFQDYLRTKKSLKQTTKDDMARSLREMFSDWMKKPIVKITPDMVKKKHADFGKSNSKARANLGMRYLRTLINFAQSEYTNSQSRPIIHDNPVSVLTKQKAWFKVERRRTYIKPTQLKAWYQAVYDLPHGLARDYFLLCILTGLRRTEALSLMWKDIDLSERTMTIDDPKNGVQHTLPLSDYLLEMLTRMKKEKVGDYVFEGTAGRLSNFRHSLKKVKEQAGVEFTVHDLRRTFITVGESLDLSTYAIKKLINHKDGADVTAGYIIIDVERLRKPMQKITDYFLAAWGISDNNVLEFPAQSLSNV